MLKAKCPKCGAEYSGWALSNPHRQKCNKCRVELVIINEEKTKVVKNGKPPPPNRPDFDSGASLM